MPVIAIDLDSVLNNLCEVWMSEYNKDYGDNVQVADIKSWDTSKYCKAGKKVYAYVHKPYIYEMCTPQPYAVKVTEQLSREHDLVIVSAVASGTYDVKKAWCKRYFPHVQGFVGTHEKGFIRADVLIDDGVHNLLAFAPYGHAVCYDQPWNQEWTSYKVKGWQEVPKMIGDILGRR